MKSITTAITTVLLFSVAPAAEKPNVLFIVIDDLNDWIGCVNGHPQALTPNIDRLAARGVLFTNAHCASPACKPSRAAVFSGMTPDKTGVWSNKSKSPGRLKPKTVKLPTSFENAGYHTLGTGKFLHTRTDNAFSEYVDVRQRRSPITLKEARQSRETPTFQKGRPR